MFRYYSKADRRAIILLTVVAFMCILGVVLFGNNSGQDNKRNEANGRDTTINEARQTARQGTRGQDGISDKGSEAEDSNDASKTVDTFDPNTADSMTLLALGLKPWQVKSFLRYRNAGAVFRNPMDITRVYCLEDEDIDMLLPKIRIADKYKHRRTKYPIKKQGGWNNEEPSERQQSTASADRRTEADKSTYHSNKFTSPTKVDVNTADTTLLKRIPGIGSNIARWIVQRREKLGGFYSIEQLTEVKHVSEEMLEWFELSTEVQPRNLSKMTFRQMAAHPYIGYEKAKAISNYTRIYGPFKDSEALKSSNIFTEEELSRLLPYLEF